MTKHRWGDRNVVSPNKTERDCLNECGVLKVTRHECQGGIELHWVEFWRGLERIECVGTPICSAI
jgi:hypothetical protein